MTLKTMTAQELIASAPSAEKVLLYERALLGCMFINKEAIEYAASHTKGRMQDAKHQLIYRSMVYLWHLDIPVDVVSITHLLDDTGKLSYAGGPAYVAELAGEMATTEGLPDIVKFLNKALPKEYLV